MPLDDGYPKRLAQQLSCPLPGARSRSAMAHELSYGRHEGPATWDAKQAAVMILLYPDAEQWCFPLTRRPDSLAAHAGQISLPGGQLEPGEDAAAAARRELHEELGVAPSDLSVLGSLTPIYVYASNFLVTPFVAATFSHPAFVPNRSEVANLIETPVVELQDAWRQGSHVIRRAGVEFGVPHYELAGERVWGATSMILAEFAALDAAPRPVY